MTLKSFPRGGKKPDVKLSNNVFSTGIKTKIKKPKSKPITSKEISENEPIILNTVENLSYSVLQEGMIILGRILKITDYHMTVTLPGQITGLLKAIDISEGYTNLLKSIANNEDVVDKFKPLSNIYKEGESVVCCVKSFCPNSKKVLLSLEPQLINRTLNPIILNKCSKVILNVSSVEDHGYVLETGLKNLRVFLSMKDVNSEITLYPGKQIICAVKDIKNEENTFIAHASMKLKHLDIVDTDISSLDYLIPGSQFHLTIKRILKDGLQVSFGENNIGYVNQLYIQSGLSDFEKGQKLIGTLLYIVPTLKLAYFSLLTQEKEKNTLAIGDIITKAKVLFHEKKGLIMHLKDGIQGYIPFKRTEVDFEKIKSTFTIHSTHKCRIIAYDLIMRKYICTMEKQLMEEQYINKVNIQPGLVMEVTITDINQKTGTFQVTAGKISGIVPPDQVSDKNSTLKPKIKQTVVARVLQSSGKITFTLKKSLIESKLPILCKEEDAKVGSVHDGTVVKITNQGVLVRFFGDVKGWIPKRFLNSQTISQKWNLDIGETITTVIKDINITENKITLALSNVTKVKNLKCKVGDAIEGVVIDSSIDGIHLRVTKDNKEGFTAFLPAGHMAPCHKVSKLLAAKSVAGEKLSAIVFSTKPNVILSTTFAPEIIRKINDLNPGDILLCSVKRINKESIKVLLPISKCSKYGTIPTKNVDNIEAVYENQILFGKITNIDKKTQEIILTAQLSKVWRSVAEHETKMMSAVDVLSCYLHKISELVNNVYFRNKAISKINIGQRVKGVVDKVVNDGLLLKLENDVRGIVRVNNFHGNFREGNEVEGSVLWLNYPDEYVEITLLKKIVNNISVKQNELAKIPIGVQLRGEIVLVSDWFVLVLLKGQCKGTLAALPARRHINDISPDLTPYEIGDKVRCYGVLNQEEANFFLPICMLKSAFEINSPGLEKQLHSSGKIKRKIENLDDCKTSKSKKLKMNDRKFDENDRDVEKSKRKKIENNDGESSNLKLEDSANKMEFTEEEQVKQSSNVDPLSNLAISDCGFDWNSSVNAQTSKDNSSSDEEVEELSKPKKKKISSDERRALERQKEREIREHEEALSSCQKPQTVDQFDRLVLSNPDSSLIWMQYMVFYLQATEIEKARSIAKRALKTINFREEDERLNIWQAWLNFESRFGSPESLNEVFQEAIKTNNAEKIYEHMLTVHCEANRHIELEKIINKMISKFKQNLETWVSCGAAFLKIGMKDKSKSIMQRALQSLPANKHIDLMIKFAQLENKFGDKARSQSLFEQVLSLYPKRTDVWSSYVDSLVKSGDIEIARKVLDRAITQTLPAKRMKVLFKKYLNFEKQHGTPESISHIQKLASQYVDTQCNKMDD